MNPDSVTGWLNDFSKRHDLPHINPHAFRHSAASVMISQSTDIVTVSKMLGHAKVSITIDIYSHLIESAKEEAGNALASAYSERQKKQNKNSQPILNRRLLAYVICLSLFISLVMIE